jgi:hypothetical protein
LGKKSFRVHITSKKNNLAPMKNTDTEAHHYYYKRQSIIPCNNTSGEEAHKSSLTKMALSHFTTLGVKKLTSPPDKDGIISLHKHFG